HPLDHDAPEGLRRSRIVDDDIRDGVVPFHVLLIPSEEHSTPKRSAIGYSANSVHVSAVGVRFVAYDHEHHVRALLRDVRGHLQKLTLSLPTSHSTEDASDDMRRL